MKYNEKTTLGIYKRIIGSMSGLDKIKVEILPSIQPHFEPGANTVRMPQSIAWAENDDEDWLFSKGTIVHEASHILFAPDITETVKKIEEEGVCPKDFCKWSNIFSDLNNEYKAAKLFPAVKETLRQNRLAAFGCKTDKVKPNNAFTQVIMRCDGVGGTDKFVEFPDDFHPSLKVFVRKIVKDFKDKRIISCKGSKLNKFTLDVFNEWGKLCKKKKAGTQENSKIEKLMEKMGKAIADGKDTAKIQEEINDIRDSKDSWGDEELDERQVRDFKPAKDNMSEKAISKIQQELLDEKKKEKQEETLVRAFSKSNSDMIEEIQPYHDKDVNYDKTYAKKQGLRVNKALKKRVKLQEDYEKRHRSGVIDFNEIRNQIAKAGRIFKPNIFERRNTFNRGGEWAIEVLVDCSGSMVGMSDAKQALATLAYALRGLPNVKTAITGYTNIGSKIKMIMVKKFNQRNINLNNIDKLSGDGGTPTGYAMNCALKRLNKFKCKKVLVVLTDGISHDNISEQINIGKRLGIETIGIGINAAEEQIEEFPNHYFFKNNEDLHLELTNLILKALGQEEKTKLVRRKWEK